MAWGRGLPIIGVLHGITSAELQEKPGIPVYLKADNLLEINDLELYFAQLKKRIRRQRPRKQSKQN